MLIDIARTSNESTYGETAERTNPNTPTRAASDFARCWPRAKSAPHALHSYSFGLINSRGPGRPQLRKQLALRAILTSGSGWIDRALFDISTGYGNGSLL